MRQYRYDEGRFILALPSNDITASDTLKYIEGARYDRKRQAWSLPASLRTVMQLGTMAFEVHPRFADLTNAYLDTLQRPLVVEDEGQRVFGERTLLPHQCVGLWWLRHRTHALLNDEVGTGKTLHAIAWAYDDPCVLICAKQVLLPQWEEEIRRMGVRCEPEYLLPTDATGHKILLPKNGWFLIHPEKLYRVAPTHHNYTVIYDESSMFKNQKARRTQAAISLAAGGSKVLCLDGNAMVNRPIELWTMYLMLRQRERGEFWKWAERYTGSFRTPYGWDFSGATFIDELANDMTAFSLRREIKDILDLPEMFERTITVPQNQLAMDELSERAQLLHDDIQRGVSLKSGEGFTHLQNLRVNASLVKVPYALDWLVDRTAQGSKVVTFSEFKGPLRLIEEDFSKQAHGGHYVVKVTGDEDYEMRQTNIGLFNKDPKCVGMLTTYAVGERGLNLQVAETVLILDLPWTPSALEQAKARVHRLGQTKPTEVITLMSGHPVEELMLTALMRKQDILEGLHNIGERKAFTL